MRRNYPMQGDSICIFWEAEGGPQEGFLMTRPEGDPKDSKFEVFAVIRMREDRFAHWATFQFRTGAMFRVQCVIGTLLARCMAIAGYCNRSMNS